MGQSPPRVLVVILNYNGERLLPACLDSIAKHTADYRNYHVVVVDNASPDGSLRIVEERYPWVTPIQNGKNGGFGWGNNAILARFEADHYVLLNNDTEVRPGWLSALVREAESDPAIGVVGCKLLFPDGRIQHAGGSFSAYALNHLGYLQEGSTCNTAQDVPWVTFAAVLIKRQVLERIGYMDEGFKPMYYEDPDFCFRARAAGFRVRYTPECVITHHENASTSQLPSAPKLYRQERNRLRFKLLHYSWRRWFREGHLVFELKTIFWNAQKGFLRVSLKAWGANLVRLPALLWWRWRPVRFVPSVFSPEGRHAPRVPFEARPAPLPAERGSLK
ncbi:MAG TPA: glycosyltransferase family 2 protein [Candidatus Thermoplasmatota archaeon]|nr:glycosyltransferase family 2 protein [Candidatus Thermoplasmatota archaeon]